MTGFEPPTTGIGSNRYANLVTTIAHKGSYFVAVITRWMTVTIHKDKKVLQSWSQTETSKSVRATLEVCTSKMSSACQVASH